jgi:hypothetical protein
LRDLLEPLLPDRDELPDEDDLDAPPELILDLPLLLETAGLLLGRDELPDEEGLDTLPELPLLLETEGLLLPDDDPEPDRTAGFDGTLGVFVEDGFGRRITFPRAAVAF